MTVKLIRGDCRAVLARLPEASIDAIVTDPPYELTGTKGAKSGFMGKKWDATGIAFDPEMWRLALRVLKPGGALLSFGGARTSHRMTCAIEDVGFEIRDPLLWWFTQGFPKSKSISKADGLSAEAARQWAGWGTALKPAYEPIVRARKPLDGTLTANVLRWGTGALNIDGCRVGFASTADEEEEAKKKNQHAAFGSGPMQNAIFGKFDKDRENYSAAGRWPPNMILSHADDCEEGAPCVDGCPILALGGDVPMRSAFPGNQAAADAFAGSPTPDDGVVSFGSGRAGRNHSDSGSRARIFPAFYAPKASRKEREAGCEALPARVVDESREDGSAGRNSPRAGAGRSGEARRNGHPTVKPIAVMSWLCRLVCPRGGVVLDPFLGSGTTGCAAVLEGLRFVGIEREADYMPIAAARIAHWLAVAEGDAP